MISEGKRRVRILVLVLTGVEIELVCLRGRLLLAEDWLLLIGLDWLKLCLKGLLLRILLRGETCLLGLTLV